jgi:23S rRNA A2030 N6-methylase RlmJ
MLYHVLTAAVWMRIRSHLNRFEMGSDLIWKPGDQESEFFSWIHEFMASRLTIFKSLSAEFLVIPKEFRLVLVGTNHE